MPTTNPVPSQDPSDLLFNAGKLDEVLNGTGNSFTDRLGVARRTVAGMNSDFDAQLADAESDLNVYRADAAASAAQALGYLNTIRTTSYGAYAGDPATDPLGNPPNVGDEYFNTTSNLLKRFNGTTWQASDINTANLAASSGSSLVGYDGQTVQDVLDNAKSLQDYAALRAYTGRAKRIYITGLLVTAKPAGIAGVFQYDPTDTTSADNGGTIIVGADGRRWKRQYDGGVRVKWFNAKGYGDTDDTDALQAAIDATDIGGTMYLFNGVFKTSKELLFTKSITIVGEDARLGNIVDPNTSKSCIVADSQTDAAGILVDNCVVTFRSFVLVNGSTNPAIRVDGIRCQGGNGSLRIYDLLVEGFQRGIRSVTNYYNSIENTSIAYCDECLRFENCYNIQLSNVKLRVNSTPVYAAASYGIRLMSGSQANIFGGAIERFSTGGVYLDSNSSVNLFGTYFESVPGNENSILVQCSTNSKVVAIGCHVYVTSSASFIANIGGGATGIKVFSRNNRIVYPTNTNAVNLYVPLIADTTASWDIDGDNWQADVGPNVKYLSAEGPGGRGNIRIKYPVGHQNFLKPVDSTPYTQSPWASEPTLPVSAQTGTVIPTIVSFQCLGFSGDDPLGIRVKGWGATPYMTVYQKGQWEKVGIRLPNQVDSTASTVAGLVTDFNALLAKLRANGVMI